MVPFHEIEFPFERMLRDAKDALKRAKNAREVIRQGAGFGDPNDDTEIGADRDLRDFFARKLDNVHFGCKRISIEGAPDIERPGTPWYWATVDPLDGSLNYKMSDYGSGLPYAAVATLLKTLPPKATFGHVVLAGIVDLSRDDGTVWTVNASRDAGTLKYEQGQYTPVPCRTHEATKLDLGSQIVIGEMYYPENREKLARAFAGKKGYLRSFGSAAFEMAMVANGTAVAFVCDRQKQHELGAGYALVKGAGGVAVDWDGKDLGPRAYDFKTQTPCVLAANREIADEILELLRKGG